MGPQIGEFAAICCLSDDSVRNRNHGQGTPEKSVSANHFSVVSAAYYKYVAYRQYIAERILAELQNSFMNRAGPEGFFKLPFV